MTTGEFKRKPTPNLLQPEIRRVLQNKSRFLSYLEICSVFLVIACSTPSIELAKPLPEIIEEHKHITVAGHVSGMQNTQIHLNKGEYYSILATGTIHYGGNNYVEPNLGWPLIARIGKKNPFFSPLRRSYSGFTIHAYYSGNLYLGVRDGEVDEYGEASNPSQYYNNNGYFAVDIIVWGIGDDYGQIAKFFRNMKAKNPENEAINDAFIHARSLGERVERLQALNKASAKTSQEIEKTKEKIEELKAEQLEPEIKPSPIDVDKQERIAQLEAKLVTLMEELNQLEEMKKELQKEREKTRILTEELAEREKREQDLLIKLKHAKKTPPVIVIASPQDGSKVEVNIINLSGVAEDEEGLQELEIFLNKRPVGKKVGRGIIKPGEKYPGRLAFRERIVLEKGKNEITVRAQDSEGLISERALTVHYIERRKNVWGVVIGINDYQNVRHLTYAVHDARAFYDHLIQNNRIPEENVTLMVDQEVTLTRLRSVLGTHLKSKAGKDDMVIIYFAGHGATEKDVTSPDGDGLEKYLLPHGADPKDLYATALPMGEVSRIFNRIQSERLIFLVDSCYSGASGGRTISLTAARANISDGFLDRITSGKGRVILTASGANEVSAESENLQHGVFTYFLLEGLRGKADTDKDGMITVDEVYRYVSREVPRATGQEQHPVKKGTVEGQLILGVIR